MTAFPLSLRRALLTGCCDVLMFTRRGQGDKYFWDMLAAITMKSIILMPFPAFLGYILLQVVAFIVFIFDASNRQREGVKALVAATPAWDAGFPAKWIYPRAKSGLFLFALEPLLAAVILIGSVLITGGEIIIFQPYTAFVCSFLTLQCGSFLPEIILDGAAFYSAVMWSVLLELGLDTMRDAGVIAGGLIALSILSLIVNNAMEYLAEHPKEKVVEPPKRKELSFPVAS